MYDMADQRESDAYDIDETCGSYFQMLIFEKEYVESSVSYLFLIRHLDGVSSQ